MGNLNKHGLGQNLTSLIPKEVNSSLIIEKTDKVHHIALELIEPNKEQPRRSFDEKSLNEMADSIKEHGVIQPIIVLPLKNDLHQIVAGERRWRASKLAGKKTIPAIIRSLKELESLEVAMLENVQRVDLSTVEQAMAIEKLHQQFNLTYEAIAKKLGKALSTVNNTARLLQLPKEVLDALNNKFISEGHARSILALKAFPEQQKYLLKCCINGWTVRQAERYVVGVRDGYTEHKKAKERVSIHSMDTKKLGKFLKTNVTIKRTAHGGRLEIAFKSDEELNRIIKQIY